MAKILRISAPVGPPGIPATARRRLESLGPGNTFGRTEAAAACGSPSTANLFLDEATKRGWIVPGKWGTFRVPDIETLHAVGRVPNPMHARLVAWTRTPGTSDLVYAGPRVWRDTALNETRLLPIRPLPPDARRTQALPAKWGAFLMDLELVEQWELTMGDETLTRFLSPGAYDVAVLLIAAADPRWRQAAFDLRGVASQGLRQRLNRLQLVRKTPAENHHAILGAGPPNAIRLLAPNWYWQLMANALQRGRPRVLEGGRADA